MSARTPEHELYLATKALLAVVFATAESQRLLTRARRAVEKYESKKPGLCRCESCRILGREGWWQR